MDGKYSFEKLLGFLDYSAEKGLVNRTTAQSRKTAANKMLSGLGADEKADLRNLDLEEAFVKFTNLSGSDYTPDSLQVYKARVKTALADFTSWADNPATFKPSTPQRRRAVSSKGNGASRTSREEAKSRETSGFDDGTAGAGNEITAAPLIFPIPVRDRSVIVRISNLPSDLTADEAAKISTVLQSLSGYLSALTLGPTKNEESGNEQG